MWIDESSACAKVAGNGIRNEKKISARSSVEVDVITTSVTYSKELSRRVTNWETLLHVDG